MAEEKTAIPPDVELRVTPPKSDTIRDGQKLPEKTSQDITDKYATHAGDAPDGGIKAWSVVLASMLTTFCTFGYVNSSWGVFQAYYEQDLLSDKSPSTIAWIGSVQYTFIYLPGLATGRLFDLGHFKIPYFVSSCGLIACTFLTAECKQYWHFLVVQGVFTGVSVSPPQGYL
ncbi:hypothetical protein EDD15DRAFT_1629834 [Pisolithus albus]|nr:hypothetical protein EDD15DRAFT_1629834 [Pisolithus albus]